MAKIIYDSKANRAIMEEQAKRTLENQGINPTQQDIYQKAYGDYNPVFAADYGYTDAKKNIENYRQGAYDAYGNIRRETLKPKKDAAYQQQVTDILSQGQPTDALTTSRMVRNVMNSRRGATESAIDRRFKQYQTQRNNDLWDFLNTRNDVNNDLQTKQAQEQAQAQAEADLQLYEAKKQIDRRYRIGSGSGGGLLSNADKLTMLGLGLDPSKSEDISKYAQFKVQNSMADKLAPSFDEYVSSVEQQNGMSIDQSAYPDLYRTWASTYPEAAAKDNTLLENMRNDFANGMSLEEAKSNYSYFNEDMINNVYNSVFGNTDPLQNYLNNLSLAQGIGLMGNQNSNTGNQFNGQ